MVLKKRAIARTSREGRRVGRAASFNILNISKRLLLVLRTFSVVSERLILVLRAYSTSQNVSVSSSQRLRNVKTSLRTSSIV